MLTVHKYPLQLIEGPQVLLFPAYSLILHAGIQIKRIFMWAKVDTDEIVFKNRTFYIIGTGFPIPVNKDCLYGYVKTLLDGPFVWHIFEEYPT